MKIVAVRRISQVFFLLLFLWFCVVATIGTEWWRIRGWPVNWFLQLDPLTALGTFLATRTLYAGLAWSLATIALTVVLGRFFCGWVCPLGTLIQAVGWWGRRPLHFMEKVNKNAYRRAQRIKYYVLFFVLAASALGLVLPRGSEMLVSLQTGLLDPIPLLHRSVNLALLPMADRAGLALPNESAYYDNAALIGAVFAAILLLNIILPRFYCRFICPLGALLGILGRFALWRIGKSRSDCRMCMRCETDCEGACEPSEHFRAAECVLCMNCLRTCDDNVVGFRTTRTADGEGASPDISRRGFVVSLVSGLVAVPMARASGLLGGNWNPRLIRPPGALAENEFLSRCIRCGQCMRICPTRVIHPTALEAGVEGLWTPGLNFRIGTSGCQPNCVACSQICPTAALRPLSADERMGLGKFAAAGPVRLGTAFVDQGRCLPWSMDRPCVVCEENCPVSPKAIFTRDVYRTVRDGRFRVAKGDELTVELRDAALPPGRYTTGDFFCHLPGAEDDGVKRIVENTAAAITVDANNPWDPPPKAGQPLEIRVRLQQPYVDPKLCIGCGVCEHVCPVSGLRAIRVTAENETRDSNKAITA